MVGGYELVPAESFEVHGRLELREETWVHVGEVSCPLCGCGVKRWGRARAEAALCGDPLLSGFYFLVCRGLGLWGEFGVLVGALLRVH